MYLAIFTQFFTIFTQFFAHLINLKGLVVFLYFSKTNSYFQGWFYKIPRQFQDKSHFFQIPGVFQDQGQIFQVCANPVRACLILYATLTPKFNLWIYVVVMECRSLFSSTVTLISGVSFWKMHHSRSPILFMVAFFIWYVDTSWALASHQLFPGHCDIDLWFQF